jgi:hypothetical protein
MGSLVKGYWRMALTNDSAAVPVHVSTFVVRKSFAMALRDQPCVPSSDGGCFLAEEELASQNEGHLLHMRLEFADLHTALSWLDRADTMG